MALTGELASLEYLFLVGVSGECIASTFPSVSGPLRPLRPLIYPGITTPTVDLANSVREQEVQL